MTAAPTRSATRNWVTCLTGSLALLASYSLAAWGEDVFRDDFDNVDAWSARPEWLTPHTDHPLKTAEAGIGRFEVLEPGLGMKWSRPLDDPVELEPSPWLE